jgi:CheY-like chemotaxis protein
LAGARHILIAEDEEADALLFGLAAEKAGCDIEMVVARDGEDVVRRLEEAGPEAGGAGKSLPALLLLDLKMPRMGGFDVLTWLQARPHYRDIPALVLSSSSHEEDIQKARELGAREFLVKPTDFRDLVRIVRDLHCRYLTTTPS